MKPVRDPGSFRDPNGYVYHHGDQILRSVRDGAADDYEFVRDSGALKALVNQGLLIGTEEIDRASLRSADPNARYGLRHPRVPFLSYPYEWPFAALQAAALLHLDLQLKALDFQIVLSDASAYNIQFFGSRPIFIDVLSLRRYKQGEPWIGYRQFCEQFLNPLLLASLAGVSYHAWFRGSMEGISTEELVRLLKLRHRLSWNVFSHIVMQARLQRQAREKELQMVERARSVRFSLEGYRAILITLRDWIASMRARRPGQTVWQNYTMTRTYGSADLSDKRNIVAAFCSATRPRLLLDIGCNTGEFAQVALAHGAEQVVGVDADHGALDTAFASSQSERLRFLPLYQDLANPSPDQGWEQQERKGIANRANVDALTALAVVHHLSIGRNIPLARVVRWLVSLAPKGLIEFVQKSDPTVQRMLALRRDVFTDYAETSFREALESVADVVSVDTVSETQRRIYTYRRRTRK